MAKLIESGIFGDINEDNRSAVHKTTRRDRAMLGVLDRGIRNAGRNSHVRRWTGDLLLLGCGSRKAKQGQIQEQDAPARRPRREASNAPAFRKGRHYLAAAVLTSSLIRQSL